MYANIATAAQAIASRRKQQRDNRGDKGVGSAHGSGAWFLSHSVRQRSEGTPEGELVTVIDA